MGHDMETESRIHLNFRFLNTQKVHLQGFTLVPAIFFDDAVEYLSEPTLPMISFELLFLLVQRQIYTAHRRCAYAHFLFTSVRVLLVVTKLLMS